MSSVLIRGISVLKVDPDQNIASLETFFLAMVLNPEVQKKAREELDKVIGLHRLPDYCDHAALPYISAVVKETLRWQPVAPLGSSFPFPHISRTPDDQLLRRQRCLIE